MKKIFIGVIFFIFFYNLYALKTLDTISSVDIKKIERKYGKKAKKRAVLWSEMIESLRDEKILKKLKVVNDFFNKFRYIPDRKVWHQEDYWASPFEFIGVGAGDCEDYAIAKYFSLRILGVPDSKLKITYVKLKKRIRGYDEAHMVLNYYHRRTSTPIVLDNIDKKLKLATKRKDLKPIYSFNASGLWEAQNKTKTLKKHGSNKLRKWQDMMSRI